MLIQKAIQWCTILLVLGIVVLAVSCDQGDKPTSPASNKVRITGTLRSWMCPGWSGSSLAADDEPMINREAGATVAFIDSLGNCDSCIVDDSSNYVISVQPGTYDVILETDYSFPDTLTGVTVAHDTIVNFSFRVQWLLADTIHFEIYYDTASDSITESAERAYLMFLKDRTGDMLEIDSAARSSYVFDWEPPAINVRYNVPLNSRYRMWEVFVACFSALEEWQSFFPEGTDIDPGFFLCPAIQSVGRVGRWQNRRLDQSLRTEIATENQ